MTDAPRRPKGWHPDPFGFYKERYYYLDDKPGRLVRNDDRVEFYDDVPEWAKTEDVEEVAPVRLRPPPLPEPVPAPAPEPVETQSSPMHPELAEEDESTDIPQVAAAASGAAAASVVTATTSVEAPASVTAPRSATIDDYFPDEPVRWRTQLVERMAWIRRAPRPSRSVWLIIGGAGLAVILGAVIFAVLPGPDHTPASAQLTPPVNPHTTVPGNFLNGARATPTTTQATTATSTTATSTTAASAAPAAVQSWTETGSYGASALSLTAVACPTPSQCYAVGETTFKTGMVLVSADGGATWTQYNVPAGVGALAAIACSSSSSCVAVGGTSVITTTDDGTSWEAKTMGQNALMTVTCPSATECIAGGADAPAQSGCDSGHTYTTTNGGLAWAATATRCFVPTGISCTTPSHCVLVGTHNNASAQSGEIFTTVNSGSSWQSRYVLTEANTQLNGISCPSTRQCVVVGNSPSQSILRSSNGGDTWTKSDPGVSTAQRYFLAVGCGAPTNCNAGGSAGPVTSHDGGATWSAVSGSSLTKITGISCASAAACVGVATDGSGLPATIKLT